MINSEIYVKCLQDMSLLGMMELLFRTVLQVIIQRLM